MRIHTNENSLESIAVRAAQHREERALQAAAEIERANRLAAEERTARDLAAFQARMQSSRRPTAELVATLKMLRGIHTHADILAALDQAEHMTAHEAWDARDAEAAAAAAAAADPEAKPPKQAPPEAADTTPTPQPTTTTRPRRSQRSKIAAITQHAERGDR